MKGYSMAMLVYQRVRHVCCVGWFEDVILWSKHSQQLTTRTCSGWKTLFRGRGSFGEGGAVSWLGNIFWNAPRCQWQVKLFVGKNLHKMKVPKIASQVTICSFQVGLLLALHFPLSLIDEPLPSPMVSWSAVEAGIWRQKRYGWCYGSRSKFCSKDWLKLWSHLSSQYLYIYILYR